jgi:hypothetical protein
MKKLKLIVLATVPGANIASSTRTGHKPTNRLTLSTFGGTVVGRIDSSLNSSQMKENHDTQSP